MTIKQQGGIFGRNPTFNDLTVEGSVNIDGGVIDNTVIGGSTPAAISGTTGTFSGNLAVNTDTLFVNTSSDKIGVGTVSPSGDGETIHINGSTANSTLHLTNSTTGSGAGDGTYVTTSGNDFLIRNREAGSTIIYSNNTPRVTIDSGGDVAINTGNVVMANGKGIDFSATAGTGTSELFDDYEEGNWAPAYGTTGTGFDSATYDYQFGKYTKIGNMAYVQGTIRADTLVKGSATGGITITGLPFAPYYPFVRWNAGAVGYAAVFVSAPTSIHQSSSSTEMLLDIDVDDMTYSATSANINYMSFSLAYPVA
mgnify:CR=1 FL=1